MRRNDSDFSLRSANRDTIPSPEIGQSRWSRWGLIFALIIFLVQVFFLRHFSIDDVAISYRYALHLAEGYGPTWNPGQTPVEGYSNFLWVLSLAGGRWLGFDIEIFSKVVGVGFGLATLILLHIICRRLWAACKYWWFPVLLVAACPVWVIWMVSGLELASVSLFLVLIVFSLTASRAWKIRLLAIGLCGLSLSRPEGIVLAALFVLFGFLGDRGLAWRDRMIMYGLPALALAICVGGLMIFRLAYYGYPVANTVYAKLDVAFPSAGHVGKWILFGLPFLAAYILALAKPTSRRGRFIQSAALLLVFWQMLLVLPVSPVMYFLHRYQIAFLPLLVLAVPFALDWISQRWRGAAMVAAVFALAWTAQQWPGVLAKYEAERHYYRQHECVVEKLARLPGRPLIALLDAGRIPYWTDLPAIDVWGLCDSRVAREGFSTDAVWQAELGLPDVYIMSIDMFGKDLVPRMGYDKLISADTLFQENYKLWRVCPGERYYGYAILLNVDWGFEHGIKMYEDQNSRSIETSGGDR